MPTKVTIAWALAFLPVVGLAQFSTPRCDSAALSFAEKNGKTIGYKLTKKKAGGLALLAVGAFADGVLQGYEFDGRTSFERKWGASPTGFWGSRSWAKRYRNGDPAQGLSHPVYQHLPVFDFYHVGKFVANYATVSGGLLLGVGGQLKNKSVWHWLLDGALAWGTCSAARQVGLWWIRN